MKIILLILSSIIVSCAPEKSNITIEKTNKQPKETPHLANNFILSSCPICKGKLVEISKQKDDRSKPSKNVSVWNRSSCANMMFGQGSLICLKDNYAFDATWMKNWELSLFNKDGFSIALHQGIYNFPLPFKKQIKSS